MPEDDRAEGADEEPDREDREDGQQPRGRVLPGEELGGEDGGEVAVDDEVVEFMKVPMLAATTTLR